MRLDLGELRARLLELHWGGGLTAAEMLAQKPDLPQDVIQQLPAGYRFRDAGEATSYLRHLRIHGLLPGNPDLGPVVPPMGYGESPTGRAFSTHEIGHGVGSGTDSGYTGSDAQTGEGRDGVPYGHTREWPASK